VRQITSRENPQFRGWLKLHESARERREAGLSLLDGIHLVASYREHIGPPEEVIVGRSHLNNAEIARLIGEQGMPAATILADGLFRELSSVATPTGIIAVVRTPRRAEIPARAGPCVMLEDLQDPGNLGSILRSAAAAGVPEIYLSAGCVHAWSPRVLRAAMGAHFALRMYDRVDLLRLIEGYPGQVIATVAAAPVPFYAAELTGTVALLFGNEGAGLSPRLRAAAHAQISIPMPGKAESLNVAAAAAVCLFERVRQASIAPSCR
jgi:TrmH family RNA methyltransferase